MPEIDVTEDAIPDEIRTIRNWICWRSGVRDGKQTKIPTKPYRTNGDINLDVTNPDQRRDFETAYDALNDSRVDATGLGFVFTDDVLIVGVDLDNCRDSDSGEIDDWAMDIIDQLDSYTEISPSGTGVHILVGGNLPPGGNRKGQVEMYDSDRYFTVTGAHVEGTPTELRKCQDAIEAVHREFIVDGGGPQDQLTWESGADSDVSTGGNSLGTHRDTETAAQQSASSLIERYGDAFRNIRAPAIKEALERVATKYLPHECPSTFEDLAGPGVELSDQEILVRMFDSRGGERKQRLYEGDASMWGSYDADYPSQSEADMALAHNLAFWTGKDPERMDALFRQSGLYREKWDRRHYASGATYGDVTLARALLRVDDYYELPSEEGVKFSEADSGEDSSGSGSNGSTADTPPTQTVDADVLTELADEETSPPTGSGGEIDPAAAAEAYAAGRENGTPADGGPRSHPDTAVGTGAGGGSASSNGNSASSGSSVKPDPSSFSGAGVEPASPDGTDTDPALDESTRRMMEKTARAAGPGWERTDPTLDDDEKHPADWTIGELREHKATDQAMRLAREDQRILTRRLDRQSSELAELREQGEENERLRFILEVYLETMDELLEERARYRSQLKRLGALSDADAELPDDPVKRVKQIMRPKVRREDTRTAKETLTGIDAVLQEYEETNNRIRAEERERRKKRSLFSRFFG
jgi:hypothetical protein